MFNVGGMELLAIALVALVVLGPDRLPGAIRQAGSVLGQLRQITNGFRVDLTAAIEQAEAEADADAEARALRGAVAAPDRLVVDAATDQLAS